MIKKSRKKTKGSAIAYALIIMSVVAIILTSMLQYISSQLKFSANRVEKERAFQVAEAGIQFYRWYLTHQVSGKTPDQVDDFWESGSPYGVSSPYEGEFSDPEGGAIGEYRIVVIPPPTGSTIVMVTSTGWTYQEPGLERTIRVRLRKPSWSEYSVLVNEAIRFGPGTDVYGEMHSNFGIRFDGLAHNLISSSVEQYDDPDHQGDNEFGVHTHVDPNGHGVGNNFQAAEAPPNAVPVRTDVFEVGREFPSPVVNFNELTIDLSFMKSQASSGHGIYYDNSQCSGKSNLGRHIELNGSTMTVSTVTQLEGGSSSIKTEGCALNNVSIPDNGIVFVENNIWLEGTINNKKVTFVAANLAGGEKPSVYLGMGNLLYTHFDGSDIIGLISQSGVVIIKESINDLTIDAAMIAQSSSTGVEFPFGCDSQACTGSKGTLTINGAIASYLRYGFALTNGAGYSHRILNFSNILLYYPPPYFPTGTDYVIDLWEEL